MFSRADDNADDVVDDESTTTMTSSSSVTAAMELILTENLVLQLPQPKQQTSEIGTKLWTAAVMLCGVLRSSSSATSSRSNRGGIVSVKDKKVLEIGAGLGACGFCSAALGASSTTIADCGLETLHRLAETLVEYQRAVSLQEGQMLQEPKEEEIAKEMETKCQRWDAMNVHVRRHLWEEDLEFLQAQQENRPMDKVRHWSKITSRYEQIPSLSLDETFDLVIGSDLLYFSSQELPLLAAIQLRLCKKAGSVALILQTMRTNNVCVFQRFVQSAQAIFHVDVQDVRPEDLIIVQASAPSMLGDHDHMQMQMGINETVHTTGYKLLTLRYLEPS